ncbi:MAG TPA: hypothetical protein VFI73_09045 [Candidatus Nitrosopolaris sp.]|nr:hypothetical protein [Candidatus Nitrosopolaris sp.]
MAVQHKKPCQKARSNEKQDELWTVRFGSIFVKARSSGEKPDHQIKFSPKDNSARAG